MKHTALVVHDDPRLLASIGSKLESAGFGTRRASSLDEARRVLDTEPVDFLVTSLRLGDLPHELAPNRWRDDEPDLPLLLVVGEDELPEARPAYSVADEVVVAPLEEARLAMAARSLGRRLALEARVRELETRISDASGGSDGSTPSFLQADEIRPFQQYERDILIHALHTTGWNVKETATRLKIGRATLYRKIDRYDLRSFRQQRQAS